LGGEGVWVTGGMHGGGLLFWAICYCYTTNNFIPLDANTDRRLAQILKIRVRELAGQHNHRLRQLLKRDSNDPGPGEVKPHNNPRVQAHEGRIHKLHEDQPKNVLVVYPQLRQDRGPLAHLRLIRPENGEHGQLLPEHHRGHPAEDETDLR
jgi:hypothetical protein